MRKKSGGMNGFLLSIILLAPLFLLQFVYMIILVGMLPTIAAGFTDRSGYRYHTKIMAGFNFAGVLPTAFEMWRSKGGMHEFQGFMSDPTVWLTMYGSAAIAWGLILFMPSLIFTIVQTIYSIRIANLRVRQKKLVEEWGPEIKRE